MIVFTIGLLSGIAIGVFLTAWWYARQEEYEYTYTRTVEEYYEDNDSEGT